jgi:hypothetical protein
MTFQGGPELLDEMPGGVDVKMAEIDMAHVVTSKVIFDHVISSFPVALGKAASKKERDERGFKETTLVYGEVHFEAFGIILEKIKKIYGRQDCGSSGEYVCVCVCVCVFLSLPLTH